MSEVSIVRCNDYNQEDVDFAVSRAVNNLGGIGKFVKKNSRVLLKPNLLSGKVPEKCVTTHPAVIEAVVKILKRIDCKVFIGDSPGIGSGISVAKKAGIEAVAKKLDSTVIDFTKSRKIKHCRDNIFKDIEIASELELYDNIINLPKVKTHGQMGLTLGVKNMFGCVVGTKKVQWHFKAGVDKSYFAKMLIEVYRNTAPVLTITDGIMGMEGNGPQSGDPRKLGVVLASQDAIASDVVISKLINYDPEKLFTNLAAREKNVGITRIDDIVFKGEPLSSFNIVDFKKIPVSGAEFKLPGFLVKIMKNSFTNKPVIKHDKCKLCKDCINICPPQIMDLKNDRVYFDQRNCIRCFCCQEVCPHGAIEISQNWLGRIFG